MAVYTCFDMVRDCREGLPEGWLHFIQEYMPFCRAVLQQYQPQRAADPESLLAILAVVSRPGCPVFQVPGAAPESEFLLGLRTLVLEQMDTPAPSHPAPDAALLEGVTALERQIAWLETFHYEVPAAARLLNIDQRTVSAAREKVHIALRGARLAGTVLPPAGPDCSKPRLFTDYIDGRLTWARREEIDRHLMDCWRCVDLFCRVREADYLMTRRQPLDSQESDRLRRAMGLEQPRPSFWQKVRSAGWS